MVPLSVGVVRETVRYEKGNPKMTISLFSRRNSQKGAGMQPASLFTRRLLLLCPLLFAGYAAIYSRSYQDPFETPAGTPAQDCLALDYSPLVKATRDLTANGDNVDRTHLLAIAQTWDQEVKAGQLSPIRAISFEDSPEVGARGSILRSKSFLVSGLLNDAKSQMLAGNVGVAVDETLLGMRLSESLKYSDFQSVYTASIEEKRATDFLERHVAEMDKDMKARVRSQLGAVSSNFTKLDSLTSDSRIQFYDYMARMTHEAVSIEDVHRTALLTKRITADPMSRETIRLSHSSLFDSPTDDSPEYLTELRLAWVSESSNRRSISGLLNAL